MKILRAIRETATGLKYLIVECACGEDIRHPIQKERIRCTCNKNVLGSKKMLMTYYKNKQEAHTV